MQRCALSGLILLLTLSVAFAETPGSLPLLKMAPDARSVALGETGTAGAVGAVAVFHNPALLPFYDHSQAAFAYTDWILDLSLQSGSLLFHYPRLSVALSFNAFTTPNLERRVLPADNPIETFDAHDLAAGISLGYLLWDNLSIGLTGRYLYQQIYVDEASGGCADLGAAYKLRPWGLTVAAAVRNLGKMEPLQKEEAPLPKNAALGIAGTILRGGDFGLRGLGDAQLLFDDNLRLHAGLEGSWKEHLFLRFGYQTGSELRRFSGGVGLAWNRFSFDYAFQPLAEDFGSTHRFTLSIFF